MRKTLEGLDDDVVPFQLLERDGDVPISSFRLLVEGRSTAAIIGPGDGYDRWSEESLRE
jgi:hypothetical protein